MRETDAWAVGVVKVYVNKETYEVCYACDRESRIKKRAEELFNSTDELEKILAGFSRACLLNMSETSRSIVRGIFEKKCWRRAKEEFDAVWVESELS